MIRGAVVLTWTLSIVIAAPGVVATGDEGATPQYPYVGTVTGTNVYVRSGPGEADGRNDYYQCAKLSSPVSVTVVGRMNNWLKILAPPGCYSVIFAKYVDADETSTTGVVTGDNVRLRAGGTEHEINFWQPHGKLNKGDTVEILEKVTDRWGDWYKITSPDSAHFWIYAKYVSPLGAPKQDPPTLPTPPPTEPTTAPKAPGVIPSAATKKAPPPEVKPAPPVTEDAAALLTKIKEIEKQLRAEYDKPPAQRNFKDLLAKYNRIKVADDSFAKPWLESRIEFLQNAIRKRQELAGAKSIIEQTEARQELLQMHRTQLTKDAEAAAAARGYPAEGILMASELFIGGLAHPKRFLLRDPSSLRISAYVQSTGGKIDLNGYAGMYVGVRGPIRYDEKLAVNIIEAETVTVIKAHARLALPAEPTVQPRIPRPKPVRPELPPREPTAPPAPVAPEPEPLVKEPPAPEPLVKEPPAPEPLVKKPEPPAPKPGGKPHAPAPWAPEPPAPKVEPEPPVKKPAPPVIEPVPPKEPVRVVVPKVVPKPPTEPVRHIIVPPPLKPPKMPELPPELTPMTQPATAPATRPTKAAVPPTMPAPPKAPARPRVTPTTAPAGILDPLPPTGLPMVSGTPEPLTATLDEREYE